MTKDNWIKALEEWIKTQHGSAGWEMKLENFISQVEHDAIEKRTKLLEEAFKHRIKPVVNLDDEDKNCEVCGYDHEYMVEDNENAYKVAHLKVELSQAIEKTKKKIKLQESRQRYKAWLICQSINRTGVKEIDDKLDLIARTVLPEEYQHDK